MSLILAKPAGQKLTLAKGQPVPNDPYLYTNTVLLLHGDGANGSTNIVDSSRVAGSPKIVTPVGNAQISTAVADPFGNSTRGVLAFDGAGDYLTVPSSSDFAFGSSSFTVECFVRFNSLSGSPVLVARRASSAVFAPFILYWNAATVSLLCSTGGGTYDIVALAPASVVANTWHHIAAVRNGTSFTCYLDGIGGTAVTNSSSLMASQDIVVVGGDTNANQLNGYIDELRITKGVARYTSNFTPPTAPLPDF